MNSDNHQRCWCCHGLLRATWFSRGGGILRENSSERRNSRASNKNEDSILLMSPPPCNVPCRHQRLRNDSMTRRLWDRVDGFQLKRLFISLDCMGQRRLYSQRFHQPCPREIVRNYRPSSLRKRPLSRSLSMMLFLYVVFALQVTRALVVARQQSLDWGMISKNQYTSSMMAGPLLSTKIDRAVPDTRINDSQQLQPSRDNPRVTFSHVQLYVDHVQDLHVYKQLEDRLNEFSNHVDWDDQAVSMEQRQALWQRLVNQQDSSESSSLPKQQQDVVEQMLIGLGFRVTAARYDDDDNIDHDDNRQLLLPTRSVMVASSDPDGVQFVITSKSPKAALAAASHDNDKVNPKSLYSRSRQRFPLWDASDVDTFYRAHAGRQGIAVLAFETDNIQAIYNNYVRHHPALVMDYSNDEKDDVNFDDDDVQGHCKVLHAYAYYQPLLDNHGQRQPDKGTVLRFIQPVMMRKDDLTTTVTAKTTASTPSHCAAMLGMTAVPATFAKNRSSSNSGSVVAYWDHWVSNVLDRTEFIDTLADTLGFTPKVDFNAGVVAAGEAQIESTVTGNNPLPSPVPRIQIGDDDNAKNANSRCDIIKTMSLKDPSQVYLPINNALSGAGHVYLFLQQLGQGIQHIASRVPDLVSFVQQSNDMHQVTSRGVTFLHIPRSYYGVLTLQDLLRPPNRDNSKPAMVIMPTSSNIQVTEMDLAVTAQTEMVDQQPQPKVAVRGGGGGGSGSLCDGSGVLSPTCAEAIVDCLEDAGIVSKDGAVDIDVTRDEVDALLRRMLTDRYQDPLLLREYQDWRDAVLDTILQSRYKNMKTLLGDHLSEQTYLGIVRNQILVDIQGQDLLYQIFTSSICQRATGEEAPFLEFIQRVCSERLDSDGRPLPVRPGCGGFGIRNFLTLFLSIEVSKAMQDLADAKAVGDTARQAHAQHMVDCFTDQLNEANPILTEISEAMTEEGLCQDRIAYYNARKLTDEADAWIVNRQHASERKARGNQALMECSARYNNRMKAIRHAWISAQSSKMNS